MSKEIDAIIGRKVHVIIDRPIGSVHPKHKNLVYRLNYGYIRGIKAGDGEDQDCYILGENSPIKSFDGVVIAIIHRKNDVEDKWVVALPGKEVFDEEIIEKTAFQEQFFDIEIIR